VYFWVAAVAAVVLTGCRSYQYRVVQPPESPAVVADHPLVVRQDPLEYTLSRDHDRLALNIANPTTERITLDGNRSYVIAPSGETHPVPGRLIGPHSFTRLLMPPLPIVYPYTDWSMGWGPGAWGPGLYDPFWGPYYAAPYYYPTTSYHRIPTAYDWDWKIGAAQFHFTYERNTNTFEHSFEIIREELKH
jgi:hypothetical protein